MAKKLLVLTLALTVLGELAFAAGILLLPEPLMKQFGVTPSADTLFLGYGLGWLVLGIALVCAYALKLVLDGKREGHMLADLLASWWIVVGIAIYIKWGKPDNLVVDTAKGAIIFILNRFALRESLTVKAARP